MLNVYLVGGAVRDQMLGLPVKEKDWVVVGATVEEMLQGGFKPVGKDFPVFLHPDTHEEYALARTERKTGPGYTGFDFYASPDVTLEQDLLRRDLTINAMAKSQDGKIIDPYHGAEDLKKRLLRHVSLAFAEDPVRILRVARFAARFAEFGFTVATETLDLMRTMVVSGEVDALVPERVWKEWVRSLGELNPEIFFAVLSDCGALPLLFPELKTMNFAWFQQALRQDMSIEERFAVQLAQLNENEIKNLCDRYRVPTQFRDLALLVAKFGKQDSGSNAESVLNLLLAVDAFRRTARFKQFLAVSAAVYQMPKQKFWLLYQAAAGVDVKLWLDQGMQGQEIAKRLYQERLEAIQKYFTNHRGC